MSGEEYEGDASGPSHRSEWLAAAVVVGAVALVLTRGVITVLVLAWVAVLGFLVVGVGYAVLRSVRGKLSPSGDHDPPTLSPDTDDEAQRAEAGHVSPTASRSASA